MYGKVLPGTYYPFRCAMKEKGISPGCEYYFLVSKLKITSFRSRTRKGKNCLFIITQHILLPIKVVILYFQSNYGVLVINGDVQI